MQIFGAKDRYGSQIHDIVSLSSSQKNRSAHKLRCNEYGLDSSTEIGGRSIPYELTKLSI